MSLTFPGTGMARPLPAHSLPANLSPTFWLSPLDERLHCPDVLSVRERRSLSSLESSRAQQVLRSRVLLRRLAAAALRCDARDVPLQADPGRPPRLYGVDGVHLSLSHSHGMALAALHSQPIGVDVEPGTRQLSATLVARFFSPEEAAALRHHRQQDGIASVHQRRLDSWLAKESLCKLLHLPLLRGLREWRYAADQQAVIHRQGQVIPCLVQRSGSWAWACCTHQPLSELLPVLTAA